MKVYHGSTEIVRNPLVDVGRKNLDFGQGFYVTDLKEQAVSWAMRPMNNEKPKYVNVYDLDLGGANKSGVKIKSFNSYDEEWLEFVVRNRRGERLWQSYDIIAGGIANDRVFNTIELYATGLITAEEALQRLKYHKPNNQICILRQEIIDNYLVFLEYERIEEL